MEILRILPDSVKNRAHKARYAVALLPGAAIAGLALLISSQSPAQDSGGSVDNHTLPPALAEQIRNSEVIRSIDLNYSMIIPESWTPNLSSGYQYEQGRDTFDIPEQPNAELAIYKVSLGGASSFEEYVNFRQIEKRDAVTKLEDGSMSSQYEVIEFQTIIADDRRGLEIYTKSVYGGEESKIYFPDDENVLVFHLTARTKNLPGGLEAARKQVKKTIATVRFDSDLKHTFGNHLIS